jgi:hypothetical protein
MLYVGVDAHKSASQLTMVDSWVRYLTGGGWRIPGRRSSVRWRATARRGP